MMPARLKRLLGQKPGGRFVSLEAEAWRDEGSRAPGPEAESPRDLANGVMSGMSAPDGHENLRDHPADAGRGILSDGQQDVDLTRSISPVTPEIVIDVLTEGPMSALGFLLSLSHTAVGDEGQGIPLSGARLGPAAGAGRSLVGA